MRKLAVIAGSLGIVGALATSASAATLGLVPDNGCIVYGAVRICDADVKPTGTGIFDPFLRTNPGGNQSPSSGWNTDAIKQDWTQENDADDPWASALATNSLATTIDGFVVFTVDINQQGQPGDPASLLSLSHFELYSCATATYTSLSGCTSLFNLFGGAVTYDASGRPIISDTTWVDFNYRHHTGSGSGDIAIYIPAAQLLGAGTYLSLLDGWGGTGTGMYQDNDGFQEWRALSGISQCPVGDDCDVIVPEPASLLLFGLAAFGGACRMRRRQR